MTEKNFECGSRNCGGSGTGAIEVLRRSGIYTRTQDERVSIGTGYAWPQQINQPVKGIAGTRRALLSWWSEFAGASLSRCGW